MTSFIFNKNQVNWTSITQVTTVLVEPVRFHHHTGQPNVSSVYTPLKSELDFDQNYKVPVIIIRFLKHQKSLNLGLYNSIYASFNTTGQPPLFLRISNFWNSIKFHLFMLIPLDYQYFYTINT